jgi:hypothetical protein
MEWEEQEAAIWAEVVASVGAHLQSSRRLLVEDAARKLHLLLSSPLAAHKDAIVQVCSENKFPVLLARKQS